MKRICVITGTRADYGLLHWVMEGIRDSQHLELQVVATGMHLSPEFGLTYLEIEKDGFQINRKLEMLLSSDTPAGITKSMGLGMIGFADVLTELKPDILLVLGDRYETLVAAIAAMVALIPIAHISVVNRPKEPLTKPSGTRSLKWPGGTLLLQMHTQNVSSS